MKIITLFLCFIACSCLASAQIDSALASQLQDVLDTQVTTGGNHGVSVHLILQNGTTWTGTAGIDGQNQPMTDSTVFISASISKLNIAILLLMLAEDSLVNLDDTWHHYLPGLNVAFDTSITIRQLLNHTSGIADYLEVPANSVYITSDFSQFYTPQFILENIVSSVPDFPAGTNFNYSNSNYALAAYIAEAATPNPLKDELWTRVWNPAGMNHTYFGAYETIPDPRAGVWWDFDAGAGLTNYSGESDTAMLSFGYGTDNVVTCPTDLARLVHVLFNDTLLNPSSMNEMLDFVPQSFINQWTAGYGLGIHHLLGQQVDTVLGHNGKYCNSSDVFNSQMCGFTLAVMSNTETLWQGIYNPMYDVLRNYFQCNSVPLANFRSDMRVACTGTTITFSDSSANERPTAWHWSFPGGSFAGGTGANDSMPQVVYSNPGTYSVTYTASTPAGSDTITKIDYLTIRTDISSYNTPFFEGFETATLPDSNWSLSNSGGWDWTVTSLGAATGSQSAYIDNFANTPGNKSQLISTAFDISGFSNPKLSFKVAYRQKAATNSDNLQVLTSVNCGRTWSVRLNRTGANLATVTPPDSTPLAPTPAQFTTYDLSLTSVAGSTNLRFMFAFTSHASSPGNNIFIDDISIYDAPVGIVTPVISSHWDIYPNPSNGKMILFYSATDRHLVSCVVNDILGRTIQSIPAQEYPPGESRVALSESTTYESGIYFITLNVDDKRSTKRILVLH